METGCSWPYMSSAGFTEDLELAGDRTGTICFGDSVVRERIRSQCTAVIVMY